MPSSGVSTPPALDYPAGCMRSELSTVGGAIGSGRRAFSRDDSRFRSSGVPVSSVQKNSVRVAGVREWRDVGVGPLRGVSAVFASESQLRACPRVALAPAFEALRRAAEAKKCARVAGRLAALAEGQPRQSSWSSRKKQSGMR